MNLRTEVVENAGGSTFARVYEIYAQSLPKREQKTRAEIEALVARPDYMILAVWQDNSVVSFAIAQVSVAAPIALLEYMATAPANRSAGLGSHVFGEVARCVGERTIVVEVDSERESDARDVAIRARRKSFYRRLGCRQLVGLAYILPLPGKGDPPLMDLLVYHNPIPSAVSRDEVRRWLTAIYVEVYGQSDSDPRIAAMLTPLQEAAILIE